MSIYDESIELKKTTLNRFCQGIEELINELVQDTMILHWDEDHITRKLLYGLEQKLNGVVISDLDNRAVFLTPFKLTKPVEAKFGDIAIVVNVSYDDDDTIEGVAFLEAKRKYKSSSNYDALKWDQLERV